MYSDWVLGLSILTVFIWLLVLTFWFKNQTEFFKSIFPKSKERDVRKKFIEILDLVSDFKIDLKRFEERLQNFEKDELKHIQKVALKRYNPYQDSGGDISFSIALLDKDGNGLVITSLHSRAGTRVFAKPVKNGGSDNYKFSQEEQETIEEAMKF